MSISCSCDYDGGIKAVGDPREVTCRTPRKCYACCTDVKINDRMYMWNMYDYDDYQIVAPIFLCEKCGDMSLNLMEYGFCFDFCSGIREQWLEYLHEYEPNNPAVKIKYKGEI